MTRYSDAAQRAFGRADRSVLEHLAARDVGGDTLAVLNPDSPLSRSKSLFTMFQIDLDRYDHIETLLMEKYSMSRRDILDMEYWAFEMKVERLLDRLKKENDQANAQGGDMSAQASQMMRDQKATMPKVQAPKIQTPKIQMPNIKFPKP